MQALSTPAIRQGHVFNDDLSMHDQLSNSRPSDLEYVKSQFPGICHVLDNPELRSKFAQYELQATELEIASAA